MVNADTLLLAGGGLLASEATGLTNFTGIGRSGGGGRGRRPQAPKVPTAPTSLPPGLNLGSLFDSFAVPPGQLMQAFEAGASQGPATGDLFAAFESGRQAALETRTEVPTAKQFQDLLPGFGERSGGGGGGSEPRGSDFKLQQLVGRGPGGIGTAIATGAEAANETGDVVGTGVGGLVLTGNTLGQTGRALLGKPYDTRGTLAEGVVPTGTRDLHNINPFRTWTRDVPSAFREGFGKDRQRIESVVGAASGWVSSPMMDDAAATVNETNLAGGFETTGGTASATEMSPREVPTARDDRLERERPENEQRFGIR